MADRYTRKDAQAAFERLIAALGGRVATTWNDVGAYRLDYNGIYCGYVVERVTSEGGSVTRPLGDQRRTAREFCDAVYFAGQVLREMARHGGE